MTQSYDVDALANAVLGRIASLAGTAFKDVPSSTPTTFYGHGPGGLFSMPGMERPVFSAMVLPITGVQSLLPVRPNMYDNPLYGIFTGVTATTGSEPNGVCDDPPVAGLSKLCTHTFVFGRQSRMTRVFDIDRVGRLTHRGEMQDYQMVGNPFANGAGPGDNPNIPTIPGAADVNAVLNNERAKAVFELAVAWSRDFARELYTGNPANNTAGGGRKYFLGFDALINTGYRDAVTGQACPAADSIVRSFGGRSIETNGGTLVREITNIYRNLRFIATQAGLEPASWVIAMTWALFYELTELWPCAYNTYRCQSTWSASQPQVTMSESLIKMRDDMRGDIFTRKGQYLLIDGQKVPVVLDDAIVEDGIGGGTFQSSIYFIPMTVLGGTEVTLLQYLDYNAPNGALAFARAMAPQGFYESSDNGRFLWHLKPPNNFCVQLLIKTEPRLLLLTPMLAARLTNVRYTPIDQGHQRDWDANNPLGYFVDGGKYDYNGYGPSYYSPTSTSYIAYVRG